MNEDGQQERIFNDNPYDTRKTDKTTMRLYYVSLVLSVTMIALGMYFNNILDILIALGVTIVVLITMSHDRKFIHIPPMMIIMIMVCMICSSISGLVFEVGVMGIIEDVLIGAMLSLIGFICAYLALGKIPGFSNEKPLLISIEAFTFGVAAYSIFTMIVKYTGELVDISMDYNDMFNSMAYVTLGSLAISLLFYLDKSSLFKHTVFNFMYNNQETLGVKSENDRLEAENLIRRGESDTLEFKSTLRTNLKTGEKDTRLEKAVLKTLTAFLNTEGGTLLIGVTDEGEILGIDEESFDNRDKMNLHMTNLISSQIGDEFLPYIRFKLIEFEDKAVMKVVCKRCDIPVFLKDGKTEQYYVRSGPSSVELTGSDMVKYVGRKQKVRKLRMHVEVPHAPVDVNEE